MASNRQKSKKQTTSSSVRSKKVKREGEGEEEPTISDCYLKGSNYAKLSTLDLSSSCDTAIATWNANPAVLTSLYGSELIGYSKVPTDDGSGSTFIDKDSVVKVPEAGAVYYPVYKREKFVVPENTELSVAISSINSAFQDMVDETLAVGLKFNNKVSLEPGEKMSVALVGRDSADIVENGQTGGQLVVSNGSFALTALMDGVSSFSDLIAGEQQYVPTYLEVLPKNVESQQTEQQIEPQSQDPSED